MSDYPPVNPYGVPQQPNANPFGVPAPTDPQTMAILNFVLNSSVMGQGTTPSFSPGQYNAIGGLVPQDEDMLDFNRDALIYLENFRQLMADPVGLAMGPGMNQFAPNAFDPLVSTSVPDSPALTEFNVHLRNPSSLQGLIASRIAQGRDASSIIGELQQLTEMKLPDFNDPNIDPALQTLRPYLRYDYEEGGTGEPLGIDWLAINDEVNRLQGMYAQIPQAGPSGPTYSDDGTLISEGGDISFNLVDTGQVDAAGNPIQQLEVIETTYTPSQMAEEFNRLGLPLPTEEFTPEYILGPEQTIRQEQFSAQRELERGLMQAYIDASRAVRGPSDRVWAEQPTVEEVQDEGNGINYLGSTVEELRGGEGIPEANAELTGAQAAAAIGGVGGETPVGSATSMVDMRQLQTADEFEQWYNLHGNELTDEQRMEAVMIVGGKVSGPQADPRDSGQWNRLLGIIHDDMTETEGGGGLDQITDIDIDVGADESESGRLTTQAQTFSSETQLRNFLNQNGARMTSSDLSQIGAWAANQNWSIGGELMRGEFVPTGGGGGTRPQGYRASLEAEEEQLSKLRGNLTRKVRPQGEEPVPPPEDMTYEGGPTELFGGAPGQPTTPAGTTPSLMDMVGEYPYVPSIVGPAEAQPRVLPSQRPQQPAPPEPPLTPEEAQRRAQEEFLRQLGIEPAPPPIDPNAPIMTAEPPTQGQGPLAPPPLGPGQGPGVGEDAAQNLYDRLEASGLSLEDYLQQQAAMARPQNVPPSEQVPGSWADTQAMWSWLQGDPLGTEYMEPGTYSYWGQNRGNGPFSGLYGLQYDYVGPGTTEQEWLYNTGQRVPHVRGPGGWRPFWSARPPNVPPSENVSSTEADMAMLDQWLRGAAPERTEELANLEQGPEYTQETPPYVYGGGYREPTPPYVYGGRPTPPYVYGGGYVPPTGQQQGQIIGGAAPPPGAADQFYQNIIDILGPQQQPQPQQPRPGQGPPGPGDQLPAGETWQDIFNVSQQQTSYDMEADRAAMREAMLENLRNRQEQGPRGPKGPPDTSNYYDVGGAPGEIRMGPDEARRHRARTAWHDAWLEFQRQKQQTFGYDEGYARGLSRNMQEQGITPLTMAVMARTMGPAAMGVASPQQLMRGG